MLKIYLSSIVIWMIILYCEVSIFKNAIVEKGWVNPNKKPSENGWKSLFVLSAIPVIRFFIFILIIVMSTYTRKQFEEWSEKVKNKDE